MCTLWKLNEHQKLCDQIDGLSGGLPTNYSNDAHNVRSRPIPSGTIRGWTDEIDRT